jgi:hypothetical protein
MAAAARRAARSASAALNPAPGQAIEVMRGPAWPKEARPDIDRRTTTARDPSPAKLPQRRTITSDNELTLLQMQAWHCYRSKHPALLQSFDVATSCGRKLIEFSNGLSPPLIFNHQVE